MLCWQNKCVLFVLMGKKSVSFFLDNVGGGSTSTIVRGGFLFVRWPPMIRHPFLSRHSLWRPRRQKIRRTAHFKHNGECKPHGFLPGFCSECFPAIYANQKVFVNPAVAALPQHAHLFGFGHGCFQDREVPSPLFLPCIFSWFKALACAKRQDTQTEEWMIDSHFTFVKNGIISNKPCALDKLESEIPVRGSVLSHTLTLTLTLTLTT